MSTGRHLCYTLFSTAIGTCAAGWSDRGITALHLPESDESRLRRHFGERYRETREIPPWVSEALEEITGLVATGRGELQEIPLDMEEIPAFHRRVYEAARKIPAGETTSYGELARLAGSRGAARAVGQAMARNPFALIVPCHRVLSAGGKPGGFSGYGGIITKLKLLSIEEAGSRGRGEQ